MLSVGEARHLGLVATRGPLSPTLGEVLLTAGSWLTRGYFVLEALAAFKLMAFG